MGGGIIAGAAEGELVSGGDTVTRAQWLHNLVVLFDMIVEEDNLPEDYFQDVTPEHEYYRDMLVAVEFGVVDVPAGGSVQPDAAVDRMFAAHTLNYCMGFKLEEGAEYTFSDVDAVKNLAASADASYADDAQIAVNRGWLALISGAFCPDEAVTQAEAESMYADVRTVLPTTEIDENHENVYQYADGVVEIPDGTDIYVDENNTVTVWQCPVTVNTGNVFVIYLNGIPQIYKAAEVQGDKAELVIRTQEADADEAIADMDAEGSADGELNLATAEDGTAITFIEGGTAAAQYEDGIIYKNARIASTKNINAVHFNKKISISQGVNASVGCTLTNVKINYKVKAADHEAYVACSGDAIVTGSVSVDFVEAMGGSSSIRLGYIPVAGIGYVAVNAVIGIDGKITVTYETAFSVGMQYSDSAGFRLVKQFQKKRFDMVAQVNLLLGIRAEAGVQVPLIDGKLYAEIGAKGEYISKTWNDGELPAVCDSFRGWMYAKAGMSLKIDYLIGKKNFSDEQTIYDFNNSPVRLAYHWEDGVRTSGCSREAGDGWFLYGFNSRYGNPGDGYYWDEGGNYVPVFTYTLSENESKIQVATITGYTGNAYSLAIPSEIDGYSVTAIGKDAFRNRADIHIVTIPDSVLKIEDSAFEACTSLQQVDMGNGVTEIGGYAFGSCSNLMAVELSKAVTKIGFAAFEKCNQLVNIEIPKSLSETTRSIFDGYGVFRDCTGLRNVTFETGTKKIVIGLFGNCTGLEYIVIPDTVTIIEDYAFDHCGNLKSVTIPDSVTEIGVWAFAECSSLSNVKLSKSVTKIGCSAFEKCNQLVSIEIPKSLSETTRSVLDGYGVFKDCTGLKNVTFESGTKKVAKGLFGYCTGLEYIVIPDTVTEIEDYAFDHCGNLKNVTIPDSVTEIGMWAFAECSSLSNVNLSKFVTKIGCSAFEKCNQLVSIEIPKSLSETTRSVLDGYGVFKDCTGLKNVTFESGTRKIANGLFGHCTGLENITIPDTVTVIENNAFEYCENLESVMIPNSVTEIGSNAFRDCFAIESITIPGSVAKIGSDTFNNCTKLAEITFPDSVTTIGISALAGCKKLSSVTLPAGLKTIPVTLCSGDSSLSQIGIPNSVTSIGNAAFEDCGLTSLVLPGTVAVVGDDSFRNNTSLTSVIISDGVTKLYDRVFQNCTSLGEVTLGNKLQSIGDDCFRGCGALTAITIPNSVTSLGTYCFEGDSALTEVKLGTGLATIPSYAFHECSALQKMVLPYRVATVKGNAFTNCTKLTEITIPRRTSSIDATAFSYPERMTVYGEVGTYAEQFANEQGMTFVAINHPATKVELSASELTLNRGAKETLFLTVEPEDFTGEVIWKVIKDQETDPTVVEVDDIGLVTARNVGTALVKVYVGDEAEASCRVTVTQPVTSISLNRTSAEMNAQETLQLAAYVYPNDAANREVTWSTSDESIASVDENGLVTAHKKGTASVTAAAADGSGVTRSCQVTVRNTLYEAASVEELESPHNYENNCSDIWTYTVAGAGELRLTFDSQTKLESPDKLHILDASGNEAEGSPFTGTTLAGQTVVVTGNTVKLQLETDATITRWGFKVTSVLTDLPRQPQEPVNISGIPDTLTYGDAAFTPAVGGGSTDGGITFTVPDGNGVLAVSGSEIQVIGAGSTELTATKAGDEQYEDAAATVPVTVAPKTLTEAMAALQKESYAFAGEPVIPEIVVTDGEKTLVQGTDYELTAVNNEGVASLDSENPPQATVSGKGNYTGSVVKPFAIEKGTPDVKPQDNSYGYADGSGEGTVTVEISELLPPNPGNVRYEMAYEDAEGILSNVKISETGTLTYQVASGTVGQSAKITVTVTSDNYQPADVVVNVALVKCTHEEPEHRIENRVEATCQQEGYSGEVYCTVCGEQLEQGQVIPKTEHSWNTDYTVDVEPTETTPGSKSIHCSVCGEMQPDSVVEIPATKQPETDPSETETDPTQPGTDPTQPGTDPTQPGTDPTQPGTDPTQPGSDPTQPGTDPAQPGTDPTQPGSDPTQPGTDPTQPGTDPTQPGTDPTQPGTDPTQPGTEPTQPGTDPTQPGTDPTQPGTDPAQPVTPPQPETDPSVPPQTEPAPVPSLEKGASVQDTASGGLYTVTEADRGQGGSVSYSAPQNAKQSSIVIPDFITVNGVTYKVTEIAANAFRNNKYLSNIKIGSNILTIGSSAFYNCKNLRNVSGAKNLKVIKAKAFSKCTKLTKITIPSRVTTIGKQAFYGCKKLKNITIRTTKLKTKRVGSKAFGKTHTNVRVKVPRSKLKAYKKLLKAKGISKKAVIKK